MFTGLITEIGVVREARRGRDGLGLRIAAPRTVAGLSRGDSVACDGVCLTVEEMDAVAGIFATTAVDATLRRTTLDLWRSGHRLHLERALAVGDRLGGHWVQGHVDGVARILRAGRGGHGFELWLHIPAALERYVIPRGSVAVDGVSLTVAARRGSRCGIALVPETLERTRLGAGRPGDRVNLEVDPLVRIVDSLLTGRAAEARRDIVRRTTP